MENKIESLRQKIRLFILEIITLCRKLPKDSVSQVIINQVLRSSTSIGANFEESVEGESNNDIINKLSIVKKEAKETQYWLELLAECYPQNKNTFLAQIQKSQELVRIFSSIINKRKSK